MKGFFSTLFASLLALILFVGGLMLLGICIIAALVAAGMHKPGLKVESGSYLVFDMSVNITDAPPPADGAQFLNRLFGNDDGAHTLSLRSVIESINAAAKDDRISGIFLHGSFEPANYGAGFAALKEVGEALIEFKKSKKPVVAYLMTPMTRDYYVASVADEIFLNPFGEMLLPGLSTEPMFYADAFKMYGIGVQVTRVGKYKSYVEPFIRDNMSPESREQTQQLLNDIWGDFLSGVQNARKITAADVQAVADTNVVVDSDTALAKGLVTVKGYLPDVIGELRKRTGAGSDGERTFRQVDLAAYAESRAKAEKDTDANGKAIDDGPRIAIVYAEGDIVDGEGEAGESVGGDRFAKVLRRLRQDRDVKAILLRVNSPGGSATASELIQHELVLAKGAGMPVIVSMGSVAASGGYWITTAADRVFAEPNTITGSIGVFGILPNVQKLANDHGITFDNVETAKHGDLFTISRPKTDAEIQIIQGLVDHIYDEFIDRVSKARSLPKEQVQEIAQGRVWSGEEALKLHLIDQLGGLETALAYAKDKAGLPSDAKVAEYPAQKELAEQIAEMLSGERKPVTQGRSDLARLAGGKPGAISRQLGMLESDLKTLTRLNDPMNVYARLPFDLRMK